MTTRPPTSWPAPARSCSATTWPRVAFKRGSYLRQFVLRFAELLSDRLSRDLILRAMAGNSDEYDI